MLFKLYAEYQTISKFELLKQKLSIMKKLFANVCVTFILTLFILIPISCYSQISIDLNKLVLNDSIKLCELNIETLTNILGRPSAVEDLNKFGATMGSKIHYFSLGLTFWFNSPQIDPEQRIWFMNLYLSKTWDEKNHEFFMPFSGNLNPNLNLNMKINDLLSLFKNDSAYIVTAQEAFDRSVKALKGVVNKNNVPRKNTDAVVVRKDVCTFSLNCEEVTKYLENINFVFYKKE